jgi:cytosine/creatinine deaminase
VTAAYRIGRAERYALTGAKVPQSLLGGDFPADSDSLSLIDALVENGRIVAIAPSGVAALDDATPRLPLDGAIILPLFVDAHTHLDKGHIWPRAPNPDGGFMSALDTSAADRLARWSAKDVAARMEFGLRCAYAHGARAVRTHIDSVGPQTEISWPVFAEMRERWRGRIALQASPIFLIDEVFDERHMRTVERMVEAYGSNILGTVTYAFPRLQEGLDIIFGLAERKGWELDFHVDETLDPTSRSLSAIADTALARRFERPILAGHCCSLSAQSADDQARMIERVATAGISVVSLPMCNLYLQDRRAGVTPRQRGVTALHELKAAGVRTLLASDNTRDPFYAYGDLDMLEVWREAIRILHLDHPIGPWATALFTAPAAVMGLRDAGRLTIGAPADMILTKARSYTELFARPQTDRTILRAGAPLDVAPPDYAELDDLEGLRP